MTHWSHKAKISLSLSHLSRERINAIATNHNISRDEAADALIRSFDYHEADRMVALVIEEDRRAKEKP